MLPTFFTVILYFGKKLSRKFGIISSYNSWDIRRALFVLHLPLPNNSVAPSYKLSAEIVPNLLLLVACHESSLHNFAIDVQEITYW